MPAPSVVVRPAHPGDGPGFLALVQALAAFEKLPGPDQRAAARLLADAFGDAPRYELTVATLDGRLVAYAVTFPTYSTFLARPTLYLEDLFVHPDVRRRGVATAILRALASQAVERGCGRFEWMMLDWNEGARAVYRRLGAVEQTPWRLFRLEGDGLQTLGRPRQAR